MAGTAPLHAPTEEMNEDVSIWQCIILDLQIFFAVYTPNLFPSIQNVLPCLRYSLWIDLCSCLPHHRLGSRLLPLVSLLSQDARKESVQLATQAVAFLSKDKCVRVALVAHGVVTSLMGMLPPPTVVAASNDTVMNASSKDAAAAAEQGAGLVQADGSRKGGAGSAVAARWAVHVLCNLAVDPETCELLCSAGVAKALMSLVNGPIGPSTEVALLALANIARVRVGREEVVHLGELHCQQKSLLLTCGSCWKACLYSQQFYLIDVNNMVARMHMPSIHQNCLHFCC
jgi:hypothetical protein